LNQKQFKESTYKPTGKAKDLEPIPGFTITQLLPSARLTEGMPSLGRKTLYKWLEILEDKGILAVTKPSGENVYTLLSAPELATPPESLLSSEESKVPRDKLQKEAETFFAGISPGLPQRLLDVAVEDWFDKDELDRDLTPLLEQATEAETVLKVPLKERKDRVRQRQMGGLSDDKTAGPTAKEGSQ